tara:strand:+ start:16 stop:606 length:591 start_codon:yes stop_codon:yes gene_type:complete
MSFTNIFTSYLYQNKLNLNLNDIKNHILKTHKGNKVGTQRSNYGGWRSQTFTNVQKEVKPLFQTLDKFAPIIKKKLNYKNDIKLINYWYNINSFGSCNTPHTHIGFEALVSGVFYVSTFKDSGDIVFMNHDRLLPILYDKKVSEYNEYTSSTWFITPENNLSIFFPSNLIHYVQPNLNKNEKRICISFNYGNINTN